MTELPQRPDILDSNINTGVWKTYYGNIRDFVAQLVGGSNINRESLLNNTFVPTVAFNAILTEGNLETDRLDVIRNTSLPTGSVLFITCGSVGQKITVKHNFGGAGSIFLFQEKDIILNNKFTLMLLREGNSWIQINTSGYIFDAAGLINNDLISKSTQIKEGIVRFATDVEFNNGTINDVAISPKNIKTVSDSVKETNIKVDNLSSSVNTKIFDLDNKKADKTYVESSILTKAPYPTTLNGVGQWVYVTSNVVPAGGTWVYILVSTLHQGATDFSYLRSGIVAGGTTINMGGEPYQPAMVCWRIK